MITSIFCLLLVGVLVLQLVLRCQLLRLRGDLRQFHEDQKNQTTLTPNNQTMWDD